VAEKAQQLLEHFRAAFRESPASAYRDWFRLQEDLREREDAATVRVLAEDLWSFREELTFSSEEDRARFFHNVAVFFGSPGPAADLARAREGFSIALAYFRKHEDSGWHARVLHNFATSLSNLGSTPEDLSESVSLFEKALEWRTAEREIARGVTLHNLGIALRRRAAVDAEHAPEYLERSVSVLREAAEIRTRHGLSEGHALSHFHLALTLEALSRAEGPSSLEEACSCYRQAAEEFDRLGKADSAAVARKRLQMAHPGDPPVG
jgi:tetratricopeptide (TPR) repeat protein